MIIMEFCGRKTECMNEYILWEVVERKKRNYFLNFLVLKVRDLSCILIKNNIHINSYAIFYRGS